MARLRLDQQPAIDASVWIAPTATVLGDVSIGPESSVWFGAVIRADTDSVRIGARTNIQDGAIIHVDPGEPCAIGANVTVGHRAIIHAATVEDGCLIGMGAIVLNGAVVGAGSIVGAGAVVRERDVIPPRSLVVGVPAKVVRELGEAQVAGNLESADHYVEYSRGYLAERR